jgi:glycosyltransferase involved in cell wall biosynthesis
MRIVIDLQGAQSESRYRGIGRYCLSLAQAMASRPRGHDIWIAASNAFPESVADLRHAFAGLLPPERIRIFDVPTPAAEYDKTNAWRMHAAEKIREDFLLKLNPDIVHVAALIDNPVQDVVASIGSLVPGDRTAATLYDLIPLLNESAYLPTPEIRRWYHRKISSLKNAGLLLAISDYSRQEAMQVLGIAPSRIASISAAIDARFHPLHLDTDTVAEIRTRYGISRDMVMYAPGGFDQRKNFKTLIQAYATLSPQHRRNHQLVIASKVSDGDRLRLVELARQENLASDELVLTGYVRDEDLVRLYNMARLFVFPSLHEGFGLPVLEAMACGVPTIGSNTTSVPEVIGRHDALFNPASADDIARKMVDVLDNPAYANELKAHGIRQAMKFSWASSAEKVLEAFETLDAHAARSTSSKTRVEQLLQSLAAIEVESEPSEIDLARAASSIAFNSSSQVPRQLLLDVSTIVHQDAKSGIQRVVRSISTQLLVNPPAGCQVRPIYFHNGRYWYANEFVQRFAGIEAGEDTPAEFNQDDIYLALDLNMHLQKQLHGLHMRLKSMGVYLFYVVYDILLIQRPDWWPNGMSDMFRQWLACVSESATGLVCISAAVKDEVLEWLAEEAPDHRDKPVVSSFHLGADMENSMPSKGKAGLRGKSSAGATRTASFLMVGTLEPRKGHAQTLTAFTNLWQQQTDVNLVIVGKQGWLMETVAERLRSHPELGRRLFWLEGISDEYLEELYAASSCLIAASEGEGFGLPLIEAAQHGLPIIARDIPVFREVAGECALYFGGLQPESLAQAVASWLAFNQAGTAPAPKNMPWLTWRESAAQLIDCILPAAPGEALRTLQATAF